MKNLNGIMRRKMLRGAFACLAPVILLAAPTCKSGDVRVTPVSAIPTAVTIGNTTLQWEAPATYEDGSPLTVAGYHVYYRTEHREYTLAADIKPDSTVYEPGLLSEISGTCYFAVTAYDAAGMESAYSNEASKYFDVE
jgi:hypothetical protein